MNDRIQTLIDNHITSIRKLYTDEFSSGTPKNLDHFRLRLECETTIFIQEYQLLIERFDLLNSYKNEQKNIKNLSLRSTKNKPWWDRWKR